MRTVTTTKKGLPAFWESGGGMTSGGSVTLVTGLKGEPLRPVYVPRGGHLACGQHALLPLFTGAHLVFATLTRGVRSACRVERVQKVHVQDVDGERYEAVAVTEIIAHYEQGEWVVPLPPEFQEAVNAAFKKAGTYHCRNAVWIDPSAPPVKASYDGLSDAQREAQREKLRQMKKERLAAEAAAKLHESRSNKPLFAARLEALGDVIKLNEDHFVMLRSGDDPRQYQYNAENVSRAEYEIEQRNRRAREAAALELARATHTPAFLAFESRATALGMILEFQDHAVILRKSSPSLASFAQAEHYKFEASEVLRLATNLKNFEAALLAAQKEAENEAYYQALAAEAKAQKLPAHISIWCRRGGRTNAGDGWVIDQNGQTREPTSWNWPRPRYKDEGDKIWAQILPGELVLKWSKDCSSAPHVFEVVYQPPQISEAQRERVAALLKELEADWAEAKGLSTGRSSSAVGDGWQL